ncbi:hypothetical protein CMV_003196 [Castanea mollissima]|uniref:Uncharacterized protein n=1 Tax=Castanea mollissima TaxID=60419 RepID=A0A8J4RHK8_9ROSI|nr:hypothetical protein CMV_003196 [Castanea mollissima]
MIKRHASCYPQEAKITNCITCKIQSIGLQYLFPLLRVTVPSLPNFSQHKQHPPNSITLITSSSSSSHCHYISQQTRTLNSFG